MAPAQQHRASARRQGAPSATATTCPAAEAVRRRARTAATWRAITACPNRGAPRTPRACSATDRPSREWWQRRPARPRAVSVSRLPSAIPKTRPNAPAAWADPPGTPRRTSPGSCSPRRWLRRGGPHAPGQRPACQRDSANTSRTLAIELYRASHALRRAARSDDTNPRTQARLGRGIPRRHTRPPDVRERFAGGASSVQRVREALFRASVLEGFEPTWRDLPRASTWHQPCKPRLVGARPMKGKR